MRGSPVTHWPQFQLSALFTTYPLSEKRRVPRKHSPLVREPILSLVIIHIITTDLRSSSISSLHTQRGCVISSHIECNSTHQLAMHQREHRRVRCLTVLSGPVLLYALLTHPVATSFGHVGYTVASSRLITTFVRASCGACAHRGSHLIMVLFATCLQRRRLDRSTIVQ